MKDSLGVENVKVTPAKYASLSLDLDNLWSYLKVHGDGSWMAHPSFLPTAIPRILSVLEDLGLKMTVFVVGKDASEKGNRKELARIPEAGHDIGNHSYEHESWLHLYSEDQIEEEIEKWERSTASLSDQRPAGFRGPGYCLSESVLRVLIRRGYLYDASTLPTYIGPLARTYYLMTAQLNSDEEAKRTSLFGTYRDGLRPITPYFWDLEGVRLLEMPVTTFPCFKTPIHLSYVIYLSSLSPSLARTYFRSALQACAVSGVEPSILLHSLDFIGSDDTSSLSFFPGMKLPHKVKIERVRQYLSDLAGKFSVTSLHEHARSVTLRQCLPVRKPVFYHQH